MKKQQMVQMVQARLRELLSQAMAASEEARDEATDEESRAESKYDTHAIEASYLAAGQAQRAEELARIIQVFGQTDFPDFAPGQPVAVGALVEVDDSFERAFYLLAAVGGGTTCDVGGRELTVLAPSAPLARKLLGAKAGEVVGKPPLTIVSVQ